MIELCCEYLSVRYIWLYVLVTYAFQSESTLYSCLIVKDLLPQNRRKIWSLSDSNWTRIHNHLAFNWTISHLANLAKWLSCVVSIYLYGAFDCMFLCSISMHLTVYSGNYSVWIYSETRTLDARPGN